MATGTRGTGCSLRGQLHALPGPTAPAAPAARAAVLVGGRGRLGIKTSPATCLRGAVRGQPGFSLCRAGGQCGQPHI